jgi:glutamine synthetase
MLYKYVIKNEALRAGKSATFMPKPIFGDNGSGMHCHQSLWKEGTPLFADKSGPAGLSQLARAYVAGLLEHAPALLALCAPTTNSYRRLVPGYEAPVNLAYSSRNRSACIRIPTYSESPKAKRIEFRCPDPTANPYLAFSAMLMAGLDGIERGLDPGEPSDFDLFEDDLLHRQHRVALGGDAGEGHAATFAQDVDGLPNACLRPASVDGDVRALAFGQTPHLRHWILGAIVDGDEAELPGAFQTLT